MAKFEPAMGKFVKLEGFPDQTFKVLVNDGKVLVLAERLPNGRIAGKHPKKKKDRRMRRQAHEAAKPERERDAA